MKIAMLVLKCVLGTHRQGDAGLDRALWTEASGVINVLATQGFIFIQATKDLFFGKLRRRRPLRQKDNHPQLYPRLMATSRLYQWSWS